MKRDSSLRLALSAAGAIVMRDWVLMVSYRSRLIAQVLNVAFSTTLFYYISRLVIVEPFGEADAYFSFAIVGLVILQVLNATLGTAPGTLRQEVIAGTFERMLVSPFGPIRALLAMLVFPVILAFTLGLVMLLFAALVFGLDLQWETVPLALPLSLLEALAFAPFAVVLIAAVVLIKQAATGATWIIALISLVSGLYFPISKLPDGLRWASEVQPFTPAAELLRNVLVGTPLTGSIAVDFAKLFGFALVMMPPAVFALRLAIDISRRRGTILEY